MNDYRDDDAWEDRQDNIGDQFSELEQALFGRVSLDREEAS